MSTTVTHWLEELGLVQHADAFEDNAIEWHHLPDLDGDALKELGVTAMGHRLTLLKAIEALREAPIRSAEGAAAAPPSSSPVALSGDAERRQLTVMFCDLADSTLLSERMDPEDYRDVLIAYQSAAVKAIERFEGYVARYMGDGLLVYFGYPQAHEDDAERAVHAGLAVVEAVGVLTPGDALKLHVRIGIATGRVVVGDIVGEGASEERAVLGETPNLASRLQSEAGLDQLVIADSTRRLVQGRFELEALGNLAIKGIAAPVAAYTVAAAKASSRFEVSQTSDLTPLVGRTEELGILARRWSLARGGEGQVVSLGGEPGIGKSRIVEELRRRVANDAHMVEFQCSPYHIDFAFHPVIEQLERYLDFHPRDAPDERIAKISGLLAATVKDAENGIALLAKLLSLPSDTYPELPLSSQVRKAHTIRLLAKILSRISSDPLLIVVEDAHWMDPSTRELFDVVVAAGESQSLLLLVTHRPEFEVPWSGYGHVTQLSMNRLGREDGARVVAGIASRAQLSDTLVRKIAEKTDGVPLYLEELTKSVLESGNFTHRGDGHGSEHALSTLDVPSTVQDSLMARLDRLGPAKDIAQIGAVLGRSFELTALASLSGQDHEYVHAALARLVEAEVLGRRESGRNGTFNFRHALMRDVAYDSLLRARRRSLHSTAADLIGTAEPDNHTLIAHHLEHAERWADAFGRFGLAGEAAVRGYAMSEAFRLFEQALAAGERAGDDIATERIVAVLKAKADVLFAQGRFDESYEAGCKMLALAQATGDVAAQGAALLAMAMAKMWAEDFDGALEFAAQAKRVAQQANVLGPDLGGMMISGYILALRGQLDEAGPELDRCIELSRVRGDPTYLPPAFFMAANRANWAGKFDTAIAIANEGREVAREQQQTAQWLRCNWVHANAMTGKGGYDEGFAELQEGLALGEKMEDIAFVPRYLNTLGWFYNEVHAFTIAADYSRRAADMVRDDSHAVGIERWMFATLNWADARLALADPEDAKELLDEALGVLNNPRDFQWMRWRYAMHLSATMAEYWLTVGNPASAAEWVARCLDAATQKRSLKYLAIGQRVAGLVALERRDLEGAKRGFQQAESLANRIGHPNEQWRARAALATAHERAGERDRSVQCLRTAQEMISTTETSIVNSELRAHFASEGPVLALRTGDLIW